MESVIYGVGLTAAALTSFSYLLQVRKAMPRGAPMMSLKTMVAFAAGLAPWVATACLEVTWLSFSLTEWGLPTWFILRATAEPREWNPFLERMLCFKG
jgi:MtN3 and saliva related transmembrane protein